MGKGFQVIRTAIPVFVLFCFVCPSLVSVLPRDSGKGLECRRGWPLN